MTTLDELIAKEESPALGEQQKWLLKVKRAILRSQTSLLDYAKYLRPVPETPYDVETSVYNVEPHHAFIAERLEALERGDISRLILSVPPRHGKSELATKAFIPWAVGRNPSWSTIMATYNQNFAGDFGRSVRDNFEDPRYHQIFPGIKLDPQTKSADRMKTTAGSQMTFVGRGGSLTGRGGHLLVIDDPIKDRKEADSGLVRDQLWTWFTQVFMSRAMMDDVRVLIIQTRWHEDDLIGRLTDPHNPCYSHREAQRWETINLPALAMSDDPLGRKEGVALWPNRFSAGYLAGVREQDARGFSALYQGEPAPDTGLFFGPEDILEYQSMKDLPENVRYFGASDHAVSTEQWADKTCLMVFAVDDEDTVWIMPDTNLNRHPANIQVEIMLNLIEKYKPLFWFAERGHISKSIGPFLRKQMTERRQFTSLYEMTPTADKQSRAQSIKGRMAAQKVRFPAWASWYQEARRQILTFPAGAKDDFVDTLSMMGLGLSLQVRPKAQTNTSGPKPGTFGHMIAENNRHARREKLRSQMEGW